MFAILNTEELGSGLMELNCCNIPYFINDFDDLESFLDEVDPGKYVLVKLSPPIESEDKELNEKLIEQLVNAAQKMHSSEGITVKMKVIATIVNKIPMLG